MIARIPRENLPLHDVAGSTQRLSAQLLTNTIIFSRFNCERKSTSDKKPIYYIFGFSNNVY